MRNGSITVFLSLILTLVLVLTLTLLESVRVTGLKLTAQEAGEAAAESIFASYDRELLEEYGLLFYDGSMGGGLTRYEDIEKEFEELFKDNAQAGLRLLGGSFYPIKSVEAEITETVMATDYNGEIFIRSVLDYYKFAGAADLLTSVRNDIATSEAGESRWEAILRGEQVPSAEELFGNEAIESEEDDEETGSAKDRRRYKEEIEQSPIGSRKEREKKGWMGLVIPAGRVISGNQTNGLNFPSADARDEREFEGDGAILQATEKIIFDEYLLAYFSDFTNTDTKGLTYELEYILFGEKTDAENLKCTLNRLLWIREGMNLLCILSSPILMNDTQQMATNLVGWTEIEALIPIVQTALIVAWSYAESLADIRILLSGGKVPMMKDSRSWNLDLTGVVNFLRGGEQEMTENSSGLTYQGYLRLFLFLSNENDLAYRAMDMIQLNRQQSNPNFLFMSRIYAMEIHASLKARPLFLRLPVFYKTAGKWRSDYTWELSFTKVY